MIIIQTKSFKRYMACSGMTEPVVIYFLPPPPHPYHKFQAKNTYYHLRSTVKCERFFAHVHFSNERVSQTTVSTGPMKMFRLEHETMNVCQRNVARFVHIECRFRKINDIFQGFGSLVSL